MSFFYWDAIIFFEKLLLIVLITFYNDINEGVQLCSLFLMQAIFIGIQTANSPYLSPTLNSLQTLCYIILFLFISVRLMIRNFGLKEPSEEELNIIGTRSGLPIEQDLIDIRRIQIDGR